MKRLVGAAVAGVDSIQETSQGNEFLGWHAIGMGQPESMIGATHGFGNGFGRLWGTIGDLFRYGKEHFVAQFGRGGALQ